MYCYQYILKQQIISILEKHEKNKLYHLHMDSYNNILELFKPQMAEDLEYSEMINDLQKIFPNYTLTKDCININEILNKQVEEYINFFEKYKNKEDYIFATLVEVIKNF